MPLQKLLFSATLTQKHKKLQQLGLCHLWLFCTWPARWGPRDANVDVDVASSGKYSFPEGFSHHCSMLLALLQLILHVGASRILGLTHSWRTPTGSSCWSRLAGCDSGRILLQLRPGWGR